MLGTSNTRYGVSHTLAVANNVVYAGADYKGVYALNADTGSFIWHFRTDRATISSMEVANGVVHFGTKGGDKPNYLNAVDATNGELIWQVEVNNPFAPQTVANGVVYTAFWEWNVESYILLALNADTGQLMWRYPVEGNVFASPLVAGGIVYVGAEGGFIYAIEAATGDLLWRYHAGGRYVSSPVVAGGAVFVGNDSDSVHALDAANGELIWRYGTGGEVYGSPLVSHGVTYASSSDGNVYALDAASGALRWKSNIGSYGDFLPANTDGVIHIRAQIRMCIH